MIQNNPRYVNTNDTVYLPKVATCQRCFDSRFKCQGSDIYRFPALKTKFRTFACSLGARLFDMTPCDEGGGPFGLDCSAMSSEIDGLVYFAPGRTAGGGRTDARAAETRVHNFIIDYRPCPSAPIL